MQSDRLRELYLVAASADSTPELLIASTIDAGCRLLGLTAGSLYDAEADRSVSTVGNPIPRRLARLALATDGALALDDLRGVPYLGDPEFGEQPPGAYVGTAIEVGGVRYGSLSFATDDAARRAVHAERSRSRAAHGRAGELGDRARALARAAQAPRVQRPAHGAAQPRLVRRTLARRARARARDEDARRGDVPRPRPLQGHQRLARPRAGRPHAARDRRPPHRGGRQRRPRRAHGRRRVHRADRQRSRDRAARRARAAHHRGDRRAAAHRRLRAVRHHVDRYRDRSRTTATTPTRSSSTPTSRCTARKNAGATRTSSSRRRWPRACARGSRRRSRCAKRSSATSSCCTTSRSSSSTANGSCRSKRSCAGSIRTWA